MSTVCFAPLRSKPARKDRERIDIRLRPEQKEEIEKAAAIKDLTTTDFIIQTAVSKARETIHNHETWLLDRVDSEIFAKALLEPAILEPEMAQLAKEYKERFLKS
jgi:uncharacterized protein (DUF1778 family)